MSLRFAVVLCVFAPWREQADLKCLTQSRKVPQRKTTGRAAPPLDYRPQFCGNSEHRTGFFLMQFEVSTNPRKVARRFLISGEVQGVGYRFFAQRAAARHQVVGYVKNLSDGRVEALVEGSPTQVEAFKHDLATGPRFGRVDDVEELNLDPTGTYSSFRIEH